MVSLVALCFFLTLLSYPLLTFLPVIARDIFHGDANTFTLFLCLSGGGSVCGALLVAAAKSQAGQARRSLLVMMVLGVFITGIGLSHLFALTSTLIFFSGTLLMIVFALNTSLVQTYVSDVMRGRVMAIYSVAFRGGMPLGSLLSGILIKQTSASVVMALNGTLVIFLSLYFLVVQRKLAKL